MMLNGQVALVTGASRGIGKAIALELGKQGAMVAGTATSETGAAQIRDYLAAAPASRAPGFAMNVNDACKQCGRDHRHGAEAIRRHRDPGQQRRHHAR